MCVYIHGCVPILGMYDACVPSWGCVVIFMMVCPVGDMCLCFDAKLVMCIHMIWDKYMICRLMCVSRGQHEVRTEPHVCTESCSYDS